MDRETKKKVPSQVFSNSERVVVDEIFDNGTTRLLRAKRLPEGAEGDFSIQTWGEEREDFVAVWRVEAFVGFPSKQCLKEGDVFFIADGTKLNNTYKPIPRERARKEHLLMPWETSRKIARMEIKKQFYKFAVTRMATKPKERATLLKQVEKKFETDTPTSE